MNSLFKKSKNKLDYIILFIVILTACMLCCKLFFPKKTPVFIFNYASLTIVSSSMEPEYPIYSVVIIKKTPYANLKVGDVIVYKSEALNGRLAFHRITRITDGGIYTKGDRNNYEDNQLITKETYVGKGTFSITFIAAYLSLVRSPTGFFMFLILPCIAGLLLFQSIKLLKNAKKNI